MVSYDHDALPIFEIIGYPNCQVLPAEQSGSETSGNGKPGRAESGVAIQALSGACWRRAVSEGSLTPTGQAALVPIGSGEAVREGESTSAWDRAGRGSGRLG